MPERYRTEYDGEFVITVNTIKNGQKHQEREWIANPIENQHISGRAAGEFYLVPYGQRGRSLSVATWLACFDGHKEVFLLGAEGQADNGEYDQQLINEMDNIMKEYNTVSFIYVSDNIKSNDQWRKNLNFESWNYAKFVSVCDI